jgi:hypothetical protein
MNVRKAAARFRTRLRIVAEVRRLAADAADRIEMARVREAMAELAPKDP